MRLACPDSSLALLRNPPGLGEIRKSRLSQMFKGAKFIQVFMLLCFGHFCWLVLHKLPRLSYKKATFRA